MPGLEIKRRQFLKDLASLVGVWLVPDVQRQPTDRCDTVSGVSEKIDCIVRTAQAKVPEGNNSENNSSWWGLGGVITLGLIFYGFWRSMGSGREPVVMSGPENIISDRQRELYNDFEETHPNLVADGNPEEKRQAFIEYSQNRNRQDAKVYEISRDTIVNPTRVGDQMITRKARVILATSPAKLEKMFGSDWVRIRNSAADRVNAHNAADERNRNKKV